MGLLLIALLFVAVVPAFLPRREAYLGFGVFALAVGLIWLEQHVQPFLDDNDRLGLGPWLLAIWVSTGLVGFLYVLLRRAGDHEEAAEDGRALWPLPVGALFAVFFFHWLSNQLAGATPAWLVHINVAAGALTVGILLLRYRPGNAPFRNLVHVAATGSLVVALLVGKAAVDAPLWAAKAREAADGAPFCVLTFAGREHPRPARHILELSPLVSRSGGRSFAEDARWLIVLGPQGPVAKRWRSPWGRDPRFENHPVDGNTACEPELGGNLR
jgi:hypothetical protein